MSSPSRVKSSTEDEDCGLAAAMQSSPIANVLSAYGISGMSWDNRVFQLTSPGLLFQLHFTPLKPMGCCLRARKNECAIMLRANQSKSGVSH